MDDILGCIFTASAGRDKGRNFIVIERLDESYVLIADGKYRRIEKPKKKKLKHLRQAVDADLGILEPLDVRGNLTNRQLREKIGAYENHIKERGII